MGTHWEQCEKNPSPLGPSKRKKTGPFMSAC